MKKNTISKLKIFNSIKYNRNYPVPSLGYQTHGSEGTIIKRMESLTKSLKYVQIATKCFASIDLAGNENHDICEVQTLYRHLRCVVNLYVMLNI